MESLVKAGLAKVDDIVSESNPSDLPFSAIVAWGQMDRVCVVLTSINSEIAVSESSFLEFFLIAGSTQIKLLFSLAFIPILLNLYRIFAS